VSHPVLIAALTWVKKNISAFGGDNPRMPEWKPYDTATRATMTIDAKCRAVNDYHGADRVASSELRLDPFNRSALMTYRD
jgi:para-nitrobenzyl esterase